MIIQFSTSGVNLLLIAQGRSLMEGERLIKTDRYIFLTTKKKSENDKVLIDKNRFCNFIAVPYGFTTCSYGYLSKKTDYIIRSSSQTILC